jgi:predicted glycosyltransferase
MRDSAPSSTKLRFAFYGTVQMHVDEATTNLTDRGGCEDGHHLLDVALDAPAFLPDARMLMVPGPQMAKSERRQMQSRAVTRPIIVPREDSWTEQRQRALRFAELGLTTAIPPSQLSPALLLRAIRSEFERQVSEPSLLQTNGVVRTVDELIALAPPPGERWAPRDAAAATLTPDSD